MILNDYPVSPVEQGGQARVSAVAHELEKSGNAVTILTLDTEPGGRRVSLAPRIEELNVYRGGWLRRCDALAGYFTGTSADDSTALAFGPRFARQFNKTLRRELKYADAVILSHPFMLGFVKDSGKKVKRLYLDSHNTEIELKDALYRQGILSKYLKNKVRDGEQEAAQRSHAVFCVSEQNKKHFTKIKSDRLYVCPNGVDAIPERKLSAAEKYEKRREFDLSREPLLVFVGSEHDPNVEAAKIIVEDLAPHLTSALFLLIGSVCNRFKSKAIADNVLLMDVLETETKDTLLSVCDIALNPLLRGSGTSLKLFDYLAAGLPVISTEAGVRGVDHEECQAIIVTEPENFLNKIKELLRSNRQREALGEKAYEFARANFDWSITLKPMIDRIGKDLNGKSSE